LVSWSCFALALWQLHELVCKMGGSRYLGRLICGLVALSPLYVFWSRTFMIESTALLFSIAFVSAVVDHLHAPTVRTGIAMSVFATLAGLVKVTTFVPAGIAGGLVVLWDLRIGAHRRDVQRWLWRYAPIALAVAIAIAIVALWTHHADVIKQDQPFGRVLTSDKLGSWLYGTKSQRVSSTLWRDVIFGRSLDEALGGFLPLVATTAAAIAFGRAAVARLAGLFALYLIPFLIFTNLYSVHNYYQYANGFVLLCAVGVVAWYGRRGWRGWVGFALVAMVLAFQLVRLWRIEWPLMIRSKARTDTMMISQALRDVRGDGIVLVFGYDWSSEAAYYVEQRAMTVPNWASREQLESLRDHPAMHTGGLPVVAVIDCPNIFRTSPEVGAQFLGIMDLYTRGLRPITVNACTVWR
jgi:hypothetical protein